MQQFSLHDIFIIDTLVFSSILSFMNTKPISPPALTADAIGFIGSRQDRPERLALFRADGSLSNTFAIDETIETLRQALLAAGLVVDGVGIVRRSI